MTFPQTTHIRFTPFVRKTSLNPDMLQIKKDILKPSHAQSKEGVPTSPQARTSLELSPQMAKEKKKGSRAASSAAATNSLKRSFAQTEKKPPASSSKAPKQAALQTSSPPSSSSVSTEKKQTQGFLMYLKSARSAKDPDVAAQASKLSADYKQLGPAEKRAMISQFVAAGGKRPGLQSLYSQQVSVEDSAVDRQWAGYATPGMIQEWKKVLSKAFKPSKPTQTRWLPQSHIL